MALFCLLDATGLALISAAACAVHELGHLFAAVFFDVPIKGITFWAGGIRIISGKSVRPFRHDISVLLAGPLFNFLGALLLLYSGSCEAAAVNLALGVFNLLPFSELDGGAAVRLAIESRTACAGAVMKSVAVCFGLVIFIWLSVSGNGNVTSYLTLAVLTVSELSE
ncbi:MAG: site-2 protease family protein [Porcipelethomonas sp.]